MNPLVFELRIERSLSESERRNLIRSVVLPNLKEIETHADPCVFMLSAATLAQLDEDDLLGVHELLGEILAREGSSLLLSAPAILQTDRLLPEVRSSFFKASRTCLSYYQAPEPFGFISRGLDEFSLLDVSSSSFLLPGAWAALRPEQLASRLVSEETKPNEGQRASWIDRRIDEGWQRLAHASSLLPDSERSSFRARLLRQALGFFCESFEHLPEDSSEECVARKRFCSSLIKVDVILDRFELPEVDPTEGWVRFDQRGRVETQLMKVGFSNGRLSELEYKPRRHNFLLAMREQLLQEAGKDELVSGSRVLAGDNFEEQVIRSTNDQVWFKTKEIFLGENGNPLELSRFFRFRAGIGAYLKEATTGFTVEYWLDDHQQVDNQVRFRSAWSFVLPTCSDLVLQAYPLLAASGVFDEDINSSKRTLVTSNDVPGGCYGIRLVDGVSGTTLDLRFSSALASMSFEHLRDEHGAYQGTQVVFEVPASVLRDSVTPESLFVSLV